MRRESRPRKSEIKADVEKMQERHEKNGD